MSWPSNISRDARRNGNARVPALAHPLIGCVTLVSTGALEARCWLDREIAARRKKHQPILVLCDGHHQLWDTAAELLSADRVEILAILHVPSYLWQALSVQLPSGKPSRARDEH